MTDSTPNIEPTEERLKPAIGRLGFAAITINGVIGAGIFGLPALAAARVGSFSPWLFVICAVLVLTIVLSFSRAASLVRRTGGPVVYVSEAFGAFPGFQVGWLLYVSRLTSMAANTVLLLSYAAFLWPGLDTGLPRQIALVVIIGALTWLNVIGVRSGMLAIHAMTILKLLPLSLLVLVGLGQLQPGLLTEFDLPEIDTLGETILLLLYAYVGFENTVIPAGEGRRPRRDIPSALFLAVLGITVLYFMIQWVSLSVMPDLAQSERALVDVASVLMGTAGGTLLAVGAVLSIGGNCSASVLGAPRLTYALARDGRLPTWFARVHDRYQTPINSILFYGVGAILLALSGSFVTLAIMSTVVRLITYVAVIVSEPRLKRLHPEVSPAFDVPGGRLLALAGLLLCLYLLAQASLNSWLMVGLFALLGSVLYWFSRRQAAGS